MKIDKASVKSINFNRGGESRSSDIILIVLTSSSDVVWDLGLDSLDIGEDFSRLLNLSLASELWLDLLAFDSKDEISGKHTEIGDGEPRACDESSILAIRGKLVNDLLVELGNVSLSSGIDRLL